MKYQAFIQLIRHRAKLVGVLVLSGTLIHSSLALSAQPPRSLPSPSAIVVGVVANTQKCKREHPAMAQRLDAGMQGWISRHNEMYIAVANTGDLAQAVKITEKAYADSRVHFSQSDCENHLIYMKD
jgi:hypothetical protein